MYPDLSYLFHDLFGSDPDNWTSIFKTFGLMLALALVAAGWVLRSELMRLETEGKIQAQPAKVKLNTPINWKDIVINTLLALFFGAKLGYLLSDFPSFQQDPAGAIFSMKGNWILGILAAVIAGGYAYYQRSQIKGPPVVKDVMIHPHEKTSDIVILAGVSGVIGAKLFSVFENLDAFFQDPAGVLFSGAGLNVFGGVILAAIVVIWYIRKLKIDPLYVMDIGGMGILVGYAVGRLGCQLSGDGDWGIVAVAQPEWWFLPDFLWSYDFPNNVAQSSGLIEGCDQSAYDTAYAPGISEEQRCQTACGVRYCHQLNEGVYPTSIYEIAMWMAGFGILWLLRKRIQIAGVLFFLYMIYNGIGRYLIEEIRVNEQYNKFGFDGSQAQFISILFVVIGVVGTLYLVIRHRKSTSAA